MSDADDIFDLIAEELLREVFDSRDIRIDPPIYDEGRSWKTYFYVDGRKFTFEALYDFDGFWVVYFHDDAGYFVTTGKGGQFKVFTAILEILERFVEDVHPAKVSFSAHGESRVRLYTKMLSKFANQFGYEVISDGTHMSKSFYLRRLDAESVENKNGSI